MSLVVSVLYGLSMGFIAFWSVVRKNWALSFHAFWWGLATLIASRVSWFLIVGNVLVMVWFMVFFYFWWPKGRARKMEAVRELFLLIELIVFFSLMVWLGVYLFLFDKGEEWVYEIIEGVVLIYFGGGLIFLLILCCVRSVNIDSKTKKESIYLYRWILNAAASDDKFK